MLRIYVYAIATQIILDILVQIVSICEAIVKLLSMVTPSILTESTQSISIPSIFS